MISVTRAVMRNLIYQGAFHCYWIFFFIAVPGCPKVNNSATYTLSHNITFVGASISLTCNIGYLFKDGSTSRTFECLPTKRWYPEIPHCLGKMINLAYYLAHILLVFYSFIILKVDRILHTILVRYPD